MIAAAFICLVPFKAIPAWVATIVVARDFLITGLRLLASRGMVLPADAGQAQDFVADRYDHFLPRAAFRNRAALRRRDIARWQHAWKEGGRRLVWITVALTIYSGLGYAWRHREVVATEQ